jgi:hypothetical protein
MELLVKVMQAIQFFWIFQIYLSIQENKLMGILKKLHKKIWQKSVKVN